MAKLKPFYESPDDVPESAKDFYVQNDDGQYALQVEPTAGWALEDVKGLKGTLSKLRKTNTQAIKALSAYGDAEALPAGGIEFNATIDPKAYSDAISAAERIKKGAKPQDEVIEKLKADHQAELDKLASQVGERDAVLDELVIKAGAASVFAKHKADSDLLMPHVLAAAKTTRIEPTEEGGKVKYEARFFEGGNEVITEKPNSTEPMGMQEFIETRIAKRFEKHWPGSGADGPKTPLNGAHDTVKTSDPHIANPRERLEKYHESKSS